MPGCAGVDSGDGFDCYGVPVNPDDPRTRRLTGVERSDVWRRLRLDEPQRYTFEEQAHIRAGTFGMEGLTLYRQQTGDAQGLPPVTIMGALSSSWLLLAALGATIWWAMRPHRKGV